MARHSEPTRQRPGMRRRLLAGVLALGLVAVVGGGRAATTEANWADAEAATGTFTAGRLAPITATGNCTYTKNILVPDKITVYWHLPEGQTMQDITFEAKSDRNISLVDKLTGFSFLEDTHAEPGTNNYRTEVPVGLLSALLGLGAKITLTLTGSAGNWKSTPLTAVATLPTLLIGGKCQNVAA